MLRRLSYLVLALAFVGWNGSPATAQDQAAEAKYAALIEEYTKAQRDYLKRMQDAPSIVEQARIFREENPQPAAAARLLELVRNHPKDATAHKCLAWIVQNSEFGAAGEKPYAEAIALLATRYVAHNDNEMLFERMANSPFACSGQFLRTVHEKHPGPTVRGRAGFHLALYLKNYCASVDQVRAQPEWAKNVELFIGPRLFNELKNTDTAMLLAQAEDLLAKVHKEYPLIAYKKTVLGKAAEAELFELRHLAIGKTAPDLEGEDLDGQKLKLSDHRGKVVVLVFWGTWCGHCMAMVPYERTLVERLEGRPFVLLGVNSDDDREKVKPVLAKKGITWRSFWDGGETGGPIAARWNVQGWPTIYVLDARGVIRAKNVRGEKLDRAVDVLLKEMKEKR